MATRLSGLSSGSSDDGLGELSDLSELKTHNRTAKPNQAAQTLLVRFTTKNREVT